MGGDQKPTMADCGSSCSRVSLAARSVWAFRKGSSAPALPVQVDGHALSHMPGSQSGEKSQSELPSRLAQTDPGPNHTTTEIPASGNADPLMLQWSLALRVQREWPLRPYSWDA